MTIFEQHPDLEQLSDFLDGEFEAGEHRTLETHLATCATCADRLTRLQTLVAKARQLPDEIEPPAGLWNGVREQIRPASSPVVVRRWQLAVAAVILVALSSALTLAVVRQSTRVAVRPNVLPVIITPAPLSPPLRLVDADYASAIRELNETLAERRSQLDPATVAKVEASLRVVDLAIGEARRALAADPANRTLVDILAANYERKVELLRRANQLASTS
jgi:hypothetical protein